LRQEAVPYSGAGTGEGRGKDAGPVFEVPQEKSLLPDRLAGTPYTTNSRHRLPVVHNLVKDLVLTGFNHAEAGDTFGAEGVVSALEWR
jgi:hypothetical protein